MNYISHFRSLMLILAMALSFGCDTTNSNDDYLLEVKFDNDWLKEEQGSAIIFISDASGKLLAEHEWSGNAKFRLQLNDEPGNSLWDEPEITVTWVRKYNSSDLNARITTVMNVPVGSSWVFNGVPSAALTSLDQSADISFSDIPDHTGYTVSSKWNRKSDANAQLSQLNNFTLFNNPEKVLITLATADDGRLYAWSTDIGPGTQVASLSSWRQTAKQQIDLVGDFGPALNLYVYGMENSSSRLEGRYLFDRVDGHANGNSIEVNVVDSSFSDFRTSIYLDEVGLHGYVGEWHHALVYGPIPTEITVLAADFEYVSGEAKNFEISTNGEYIESTSRWTDFNYHSSGESYWSVISNDSTTKYSLPVLPRSVLNRFGLVRDEFSLTHTELYNFPGVENYQAFLRHSLESEAFFLDQIPGWNSRGKNYYAPNVNAILENSTTNRRRERFEFSLGID